jgi:predicted transcriptional regulator of viral defense system
MRKKIEIEKLKNYDKAFFGLGDLVKIFNVKEESLKVTLSRWVKNGKILRIRKNAYQLPDKAYDLRKAAWQFYQPCYLSFESALNKYSILSQIPYVNTFATVNKSKKITLGREEVEFRQIKRDLFFGYKTENGLLIALPEKALADQIYFVSRGLANLNFEELDLSNISLKKFKSLIKLYPKPTQILAKNIELYFGKTAVTIK